MPRGGERRRFSSAVQFPFVLPPGPLAGPQAFYPGYYPGYYGTPWYVPQTMKYKYPAPIYEEPRLGLQYHYPYAYQFGIQIPPETDEPAYVAPFGPRARGFARPAVADGIELMKKGLYAEAGRRFASAMKGDEAAPEVYLLTAEALFALGKFQEAEIVLRHAIEGAPDLGFLDQADLQGKFPSRDALNEKLKALPGDRPLLRGTMRILAGEGEQGLKDLSDAAQGDKDQAAKRVYLHFVGAAFGPAEEKKPAEPKKST